jgi:K+-transporting ATPase ATPase A chain
MAMLYVLIFPAVILVLTAVSVLVPPGLAGVANAGPHGLSEILYAFSSVTGNNGSAFAGLDGASYWYNTLLGAGTLVGRFAMMVPMLALAGFLSERKTAPESAGTFPVTGPLFVTLLVGVVVIVGALTFFPALSLGPIVEHLAMTAGRTF